MGDSDRDLSRILLWIASDLDARYYGYTGAIRQAAAALATLPDNDDDQDRCGRCGDPIVQPATGRPRRWCSDRCRKGQRRRTKPDVTVS